MMFRVVAFVTLLLTVNAYPTESSGNVEGSAIKTSDRVKRDTILIEKEGDITHIIDFITDGSSLEGSGLFGSGDASGLFGSGDASGLFGSGDASGLFGSGDISNLIDEEESIFSNRNSEAEGSGVGTSTNATTTECAVLGECYNDDDCNGGKCVGAFLGTCNCNACVNFWMCASDNDCGGLKHSCSNGFCDCYGGFVRNNFTSVIDAWTNLCNAKNCKKESMVSDCFGLSCNKGFCAC